MEKKNKKPKLRTVFVLLLLIFIIIPFVINGVVIGVAKPYIMPPNEARGLDADCILVLGARVWSSGNLSAMLEDRVLQGIRLYEMGVSDRLLMSGDHGQKEYDEVNHMKKYAVEKGIQPDHIFMDHAGFSTYESMYRARDVFKAEKIVIVTQEFHLYRAVYVARALGLEAYGVATEPRSYKNEFYSDFREFFARIKDFLMAVITPLPTYLGEAIPISGSGALTND